MLPFVMALAAALMLAAAMLVTMGNSGLFGAFSQARTKDARQAAEQGVDVIINTLNASRNRKLLVANVPMGSWGDSSNTALLTNPCASSGPTAAATNLGQSTEVALAGDTKKTFVLKRLTLRNPDRVASYSSSGSPGNPATSGSTTGTYSVSAIDIFPSQPKPGYVELVVEGRIYDANNNLKSTAQVTREFAVIPKCCNIGFTQPYSTEPQATCQLPPTLVVGLSTGNYQFSPASGSDRITSSIIQTTSWDSSGVSPYVGSTMPSGLIVRNDLLYCAKTSSGCNNQFIFGSATTRLTNLGVSSIPSLAYPSCTGSLCNSGFVYDNQPSTDNYSVLDYIRVDRSGRFVQLCNANTAATDETSIDRQSLASTSIGGCTEQNTSIDSFCLRGANQGAGASVPTFYCRISSLSLRDVVTSTAGNQTVANRRQNNTLWIDTTNGYIVLYFASPWAAATPITLLFSSANAFADGQIQHVNCRDNDGLLLDNYDVGAVNACAREALPKYWPRAMIYSDTSSTVDIGDDGYIRGMRLYLPNGSVRFNYSTGCRPPQPIYSGILWANRLQFNLNTTSPCSTSIYTNDRFIADILVPRGGASLTANSFDYPPPYEWVARGSTYTSLF